MILEEIKKYKKALYLTKSQFKKWSKSITPKLLRFTVENQDMIKFITDNDITFDEIQGLRLL